MMIFLLYFRYTATKEIQMYYHQMLSYYFNNEFLNTKEYSANRKFLQGVSVGLDQPLFWKITNNKKSKESLHVEKNKLSLQKGK